MLQLTPFLLFDGNCAEAMKFYAACFGGELALTPLADTPMKEQFPESQHHKITYAHLKSSTIEFSATDWLHPTQLRQQGNTSAMYLTGAHGDGLRKLFDKLADGGDREHLVELKEMPFGLFGRLADRFGVVWFFRGEKTAE
jgi:PhnB protein